MDIDVIKKLLEDYNAGEVSINDVLGKIKELPYKDIGFAKVDSHRKIRCGFPEVIFCMGKTTEQVVKIVEHIVAGGNDMLATRASTEIYRPFQKSFRRQFTTNRRGQSRYEKPGENLRKGLS